MERYSGFRLMKKSVITVLSLVIICLIFTLSFRFTKKIDSKSISDSIVYIESINDDAIVSGNGFVFKIENGKNYIITNYHVIEGSFNILVYNASRKKEKAKLIDYDASNDIAILSIDDTLNLKEANIGKSSSIKNKGKIYTVDCDNIKRINSGSILSTNELQDLFDFNSIKISAKLDLGNSGGPLLDRQNRVIGVLFLKDQTIDGIGYAIPIDFVMNYVNRVNLDDNAVSLGAVMSSSENIDILNQYNIPFVDMPGVVLLKLDNNGVLFSNGFEIGDIIISFNGISIQNTEDLKLELKKYKKGDIVQIIVYRNNKNIEKSISL